MKNDVPMSGKTMSYIHMCICFPFAQLNDSCNRVEIILYVYYSDTTVVYI